MSRAYGNVKEFEKEIQSLKDLGYSHREIGERLGFSKEQVKEFFRIDRKKTQKAAEQIPKIRRNFRKTLSIIIIEFN